VTAPSDPAPSENSASEESRTRIIRRAPTGPIPTIAETPTTHIPRESVTAAAAHASPAIEPSSRTAVAACAVSIVSGWATSVVATALVTGWWHLNQLFCIAVAFLALVFGIATVWGVVALLQRRPIGRWLIVVGAIVALVTYGGLFIAGAQVARIVYLIPALPLASIALALHWRTNRWVAD
jgi:hypothetical protein